MFKGKINPVSNFSEKTKFVWTDENGRLTVHVESTDPVEFLEAQKMLKQGLAYIYNQMNVPFPSND
jgi:hypothetical protein